MPTLEALRPPSTPESPASPRRVGPWTS